MTSARCTRHSPRYGTISGCRFAPAGQRLRPLTRTSDVEQVGASGEYAAIDQYRGNDRGYFASGDCDHHFVQQRHAALDVAALDERTAVALPRKIHQIGIAKPRADVGGFREFGFGVGDMAAQDRLTCRWQQKIPSLDPGFAALFKQPRRACHPARCLRRVTRVHQDRCDPRRDSTGAAEFAVLDEAVMRAHQRRDAFAVFANEISGRSPARAVSPVRAKRLCPAQITLRT